MAIAFVQHNSASTGSSASASVTFSSSTTAGNCLVVIVSGYNSAPAYAVSDLVGGNSNTWSSPTNARASQTPISIQAFVALGIANAGASHQITVNFTPSAYSGIWIAEFSGVAASSADDGSANTSNTSATTHNCGSITTSVAGDLLLGGMTSTSALTGLAAGSGYTLGANITSAANESLGSVYKIAGGAGSENPQMTTSGSLTSYTIAFALKAAAAAASPLYFLSEGSNYGWIGG